MSDASGESETVLEGPDGPRRRAFVAREGSSFVFLVSGLVVLIATIFYDQSLFAGTTSKCPSFSWGTACSSEVTTRGFLGSGFGAPVFAAGNESVWATTYWVTSIFLATCAVVAFFWLRSRVPGKQAVTWPSVTLVAAAVVLVTLGRGFLINQPPPDMVVRGMQALLVVALGLFIVASIARSWALSIYVAGFFGLALLSCLYNVSNLFQRIGIGGAWNSSNVNVPNLTLPGVYLLAGAGASWMGIRIKRAGAKGT